MTHGLAGGCRQTRFDEILERVERKVLVDDATEYSRVGVRWYGNGTFIRDRTLGADIARKQQWILRAGDIVYNKLFAWKGAFAIADDEVDGHLVSDKFPTYILDTSTVDPRYVAYYFRTHPLAFQAELLSKGAAAISKLTLNPPQFWDLTIPLPQLAEQQRIADWMDKIVQRTESAYQMRAIADAETTALASAQARNLVTESAYDTRPLGDLVTVRGGGTPEKGNLDYWSGRIPWVSPKDMKARELFDSIDHISELATAETSARLLDPDCVLVVTRGMILAHTVPVAILRVPAAINQDMKALTPIGGITCEYLCGVLWALNGQLVNLVERSTHDTRKLQTPTLLGFEVPLPTPQDQLEIVERLKEVHDRHEALRGLREEVNRSLEAVLPSVLNDVFGGLWQDGVPIPVQARA